MLERDADVAGGKQGGTGMGAVVVAGKLPDAAADPALGAEQRQLAPGIVARHPIAGRIIEALDRRPAAARQHAFQAGLGGIGNDQAVGWQSACLLYTSRCV